MLEVLSDILMVVVEGEGSNGKHLSRCENYKVDEGVGTGGPDENQAVSIETPMFVESTFIGSSGENLGRHSSLRCLQEDSYHRGGHES